MNRQGCRNSALFSKRACAPRKWTPLCVVLCLTFFSMGLSEELSASGMQTEPFSYTQDFESQCPAKFAWNNGDYRVNYEGLTTERSAGGDKSLKLDVTLRGTAWVCWLIPLPAEVPVERGIRVSFDYYIDPASTANDWAWNLYYSYPPIDAPFYQPVMNVYTKQNAGMWKTLQADAAAFRTPTRSYAAWGVEAQNVMTCLRGIGIEIRGSAGDRMVLYIDNFKVSGKVPSAAAYQHELRDRWSPAREQIAGEMRSWTSLSPGTIHILKA